MERVNIRPNYAGLFIAARHQGTQLEDGNAQMAASSNAIAMVAAIQSFDRSSDLATDICAWCRAFSQMAIGSVFAQLAHGQYKLIGCKSQSGRVIGFLISTSNAGAGQANYHPYGDIASIFEGFWGLPRQK